MTVRKGWLHAAISGDGLLCTHRSLEHHQPLSSLSQFLTGCSLRDCNEFGLVFFVCLFFVCLFLFPCFALSCKFVSWSILLGTVEIDLRPTGPFNLPGGERLAGTLSPVCHTCSRGKRSMVPTHPRVQREPHGAGIPAHPLASNTDHCFFWERGAPASMVGRKMP